MANDPIKSIRSKLLNQLGITSSALTKRVGRLAHSANLSRDDALLILARQHNVNISAAGDEALTRVRKHLSQEVPRPASSANSRPSPRSKPRKRQVVIRIGNTDVGAVPCMDAALLGQAREVAQESYVRLFLLENSARELIRRVMTASHGTNWWATRVDRKLQSKADGYAKNEGRSAWHPSRGADPILFVDLTDLVKIVESNWPDFEPIFSERSFFKGVVEDLNVTRRLVAHMNRPDDDAALYVRAGFQKWTNLLQAKSGFIPT